KIQEAGIEPEEWWALESEIPYKIKLTWSGEGAEGCYDVIFQHNDSKFVVESTVIASIDREVKSWSAYANQPYQGAEDRHLIPQLRSFLEDKLPDYMIPSAFMVLDKLPLTPSGKIDRRSLPSPQISRRDLDVDFVASRTATEEILATIWAEVIGLDQVGIYDNFFHLGGDSIQATQLISRIRDKCQIELPLRYLFESPNVAELSQKILEASQDKLERLLPAIEPVSRKGELLLSFAQQRLWFLDQLQSGSTAYNEPSALHLEGELNVETLEKSLNAIAQRHEILRTNFQTVDGSPVQVISPHLELNLPIVDLQHLPTEQQWNEVQRLGREAAEQYFDLAVDCLLRVTLLKLAEDDHVLLLTMHHIISDGWSMGVLIEELAQLYQADQPGKPSPLSPLPIQYGDFALWQRQWFTQELLGEQLDYWKQHLAGVPPLLELPTDRPRPKMLSDLGSHIDFELDGELTTSLNALSNKSEATLYMILLAGFVTLLYRYSGQEDIVVGSPVANRNRSEMESLLGFFVNTLVLRNDLSGDPSFLELLSRVRDTALGAYEHRDVPFEQLVEILQPERSLSYSPLFQVAFAFQQAQAEQQQWGELTLTPLKLASVTTKFDLTLFLEETDSGIEGRLEYNTDLFDATTMAQMVGHFQTLLEAIVTNPQERIAQLPMLTTTERHQLLVEWNDTATEYPQDKCIHQLFEEQVERTPDAVAAVFEDTQITYQELNHRANQLAHYLQSKGVAPDVLVGICVERSLEMIVGLLGILKAGGAYVPLAPAYPQERLWSVLSDSQASVLLTQQRLTERLPQNLAQVICIDSDLCAIAGQNKENLVSKVQSSNLAYIIYTSGSTGKPKGVQIEHRSVINLLNSIRKQPGLTDQDTVLAVTTISFDVAVSEIFLPLSVGAKLVVVSSAVAADGKQLLQALNTSDATFLHPTPITWRLLLAAGWQSSKNLKMVSTGEALTRELAAQLLPKGAELWNLYGPTEITIWATGYKVESGHKPILIGRPLDNTQIYILDSHQQPVPIGVPGELHIGGAGLARGYLNRPELTAEKFIWHETLGTYLYKTGDLVRYLANGNIECLGRIDNQVKIRGFRIELGEIETILSQHPLVQETVVIAREDEYEQKRLLAYVVLKKEKEINSK
ncbi:MAG: amino acid adenylation domain-containing protein, partial [Cyanobacteria bacterium P01_A01_bin.83]